MNSLTLQNDDLYNDLASPGRWRVQIIFGSYPPARFVALPFSAALSSRALRTGLEMRRNDIYSSLVWVLVGVGFIWGGLKMGIGPLDAPGPGFFPAMIGAVFSLLSLALFITTSLIENQLPEKVSFWKEEKSWIKVFLSLFSLIFYLVALNYLGYILTTFLFLLYLLKFVGKRGWGVSLLIAIMVSLGSFTVFKTTLGVYSPEG